MTIFAALPKAGSPRKMKALSELNVPGISRETAPPLGAATFANALKSG